MEIVIRPETGADIASIDALTRKAFEVHPISRHTEQFIIKALRTDGALTVSLVAETGGRRVGHIAFSPVTISDGSAGWFGLGPISVLPEFQRQGVGTRLMRAGLEAIRRDHQAKGCVLAGDPGFYGRFGFRADPGLRLEGVPPQYFLTLGFDGNRASGDVAFHPAFAAES